MNLDVMIKLLPGGIMPRYMSAGAAGMDCYAAIDDVVVVPAYGRRLISLGFCISLPEGYEAQVRPRSGMLRSDGVFAALGTIDADYRGEVAAMLLNIGSSDLYVEGGMRVCQLVIAPVMRAIVHQVDELTVTERGTAGFGSTGK